MIRFLTPAGALLAGLSILPVAAADEPSAAERGKAHLLGQAYNPPTITASAYDNVWKQWGLKEKPAPDEYARLFRERYGFHPAPYPNGGYPMGLREADLSFSFGRRKGVAQDCLICHGGSIAGQSYVGLGNSCLDYQTFSEEMDVADGRSGKTPFTFCNVRGTVEAGGMAVFLLGYREPDLSLRISRLDLDLHDDMCEDTPAWWLLKKKKTMYYDGGGDPRSVRSLMQFMMSPLNFPSAFEKAEPDFKDIREFLLSIQPPKYPLPIDAELADAGRDPVLGQLRPLPRHLRRALDLPQQDHPDRQDRHRPQALRRPLARSSANTTTRAGSPSSTRRPRRSAIRRRRSTASGPPRPTSTTAPPRRSTTS